MRRLLWFAVPAVALGLVACFASPSPVQDSGGCSGVSCRGSNGRSQGGSGASAASGGVGSSGDSSSGGSTAGSTAGSGSSSGGSTASASSGGTVGGSSTGGSSSSGGNSGGLLACQGSPPCQPALCYQVVDVETSQPIAGATVGAWNAAAQPLVGLSGTLTTETDGSFLACLPAGVPFTLYASAGGYQASDLAQLQDVASSFNYLSYVGQLSMFTTSVFEGLQPYFVNLTPGTSILAVTIGGSVGGASCSDPSGFVFSVELPDGGLLGDGGGYGVSYVNTHNQPPLPDSNLSETDDGGTAFIYNVDSTLTNGSVVVVATPRDAGPGCQGSVNYGALGMTGQLYVGPSSFTLATIPLGP
ncbi:MAG: peptidase associated/transthyretin-like domain-containing protein [Myxococcales bacterium]